MALLVLTDGNSSLSQQLIYDYALMFEWSPESNSSPKSASTNSKAVVDENTNSFLNYCREYCVWYKLSLFNCRNVVEAARAMAVAKGIPIGNVSVRP